MCITSLKKMYSTYVTSDSPLLKYILTYKLSQDHIEIFFSIIRSKGGFNNNPSARQFEAIYKKLLVHIEVKYFNTGNAIALDNTSILSCSSVVKTNLNENLLEGEQLIIDNINDHDYAIAPVWHLTCYVEDVIAYIAGFVIKKIKKVVSCSECFDMLEVHQTFSKL